MRDLLNGMISLATTVNGTTDLIVARKNGRLNQPQNMGAETSCQPAEFGTEMIGTLRRS